MCRRPRSKTNADFKVLRVPYCTSLTRRHPAAPTLARAQASDAIEAEVLGRPGRRCPGRGGSRSDQDEQPEQRVGPSYAGARGSTSPAPALAPPPFRICFSSPSSRVAAHRIYLRCPSTRASAHRIYFPAPALAQTRSQSSPSVPSSPCAPTEQVLDDLPVARREELDSLENVEIDPVSAKLAATESAPARRHGSHGRKVREPPPCHAHVCTIAPLDRPRPSHPHPPVRTAHLVGTFPPPSPRQDHRVFAQHSKFGTFRSPEDLPSGPRPRARARAGAQRQRPWRRAAGRRGRRRG